MCQIKALDDVLLMNPPYLTYANSKREREYPSIPDQLDMQYHDTVNSTTTWKDAIKAIKDKYPKDGETSALYWSTTRNRSIQKVRFYYSS